MNTFSQKISHSQAETIKNFLYTKGCKFDTVQYSYWRAKSNSFQAVYYTSGKLLVQGKEIDSVICKIGEILGVNTAINNVKHSNINIEIPLNNSILYSAVNKSSSLGYKGDENLNEKYIGTDESGKGDFFGPLVIAGVQVNKDIKQKFINLGIKDSKKLDDAKIQKLSILIKANSVHSVIVIMPQKYNELYLKFNNLNKLLAWGHARAIENILEKSPCEYALADKFGDESLIQNALMTKGRNIILKQMVRAEADIAVAAASVLARAEFVKRMQELQNKFELPLSKGVSQKVIEQARTFVGKYSFDRLKEVAKMHFKTVKEIQ